VKRRVFLASMLGGLLGGRVHSSYGVQLRKGAARIGFIQPVLALRMPFWQSFFDTLRERGWREGVEYVLELRETFGDPARALQAARELVRQRVDLIVAISTAPAVAARQVTDRVPVVTWCGYPVEAGLAASLSRPGGNVTGVANYAGGEVWGKFVALLRELRPELRQLGILWDYTPPAFPDGLVPLPYIQSSARQAGIETRIWMTRTEADLVDALSEIDAGPIGALIISTGGGVHMQPAVLERIAALIARRRLPAITDIASTTVFGSAGCVLAYSPDVAEILGRLALFVDRILRGASPAELPFELPSRFDLAVNAKHAKALGLTLPQTILLRADRVIE
jgi:putative tryptophan/tyrosine transport system substrate-binding protein